MIEGADTDGWLVQSCDCKELLDSIETEIEDEDFDDSPAWEDDSNRGCKDCPDDECTGHCMSCYYRPV